MPPINRIDHEEARKIRRLIQAKLDELGRELNLKFTMGNARFDNVHIRFLNVTATLERTAEGQAFNLETAAFRRYAVLLGLQPDDLGRTFVSLGKRLKIIGLKPNARKNNILTEDQFGRRYVIPHYRVSQLLVREPAPSTRKPIPRPNNRGEE